MKPVRHPWKIRAPKLSDEWASKYFDIENMEYGIEGIHCGIENMDCT